jgi:hypothetical protein
VAQLERALITERTKGGLAAGRRGRIGGNPGLRRPGDNPSSPSRIRGCPSCGGGDRTGPAATWCGSSIAAMRAIGPWNG